MGIPDSSLLDLIEKVRSWIPWGGSDISGVSQEYWTTPHSSFKMCWECETRVTEFGCKCHCKHCGRVLCGRSVSFKGTAETEEYMCKSCSQDGSGIDTMEDYCVRVDSSPRDSPERGFNSFDREKFSNNDNTKATRSENLARFLDSQHHDSSPRAVASSSSYTDHLSPISFRRSSSRSDEEDAEDSRKQLFSPLSEFSHDVSDIDSNSISATHDFYSSSPLDSPCRIATTPTRAAYMQREQEGMRSYQKASHPFEKENETISRRFEVENEYQESNDESSHDMSIHQNQYAQPPLDFESNGLIWFPPPPDEEEDDIESDFFKYADDDDDMGGSDMVFPSSSFSTDTVSVKDKLHEEPKEPLRAMVHGHFRALVSQLLQGEGILMGNESDGDDWLDIVSSLAWQAANFVKPDTSKGGSMDPGDYVKVKCIVSGRPKESTLIKGVVCTKNIKHKRMTSQYRNPRLFLMRGSIEYQRDADQLASFNTLLQQEIDHLKMVVSKIEAHRPNVLLVEKSVSSYAQEYLLEKEISLVLNVKRPLLERIARCTGAHIVPSTDNLSQARVGHCEVFRLERVLEDCATASHPNKKLAKTLMFFEGCPRRLGCTVLLKGAALETLKKVKHVVQYAVFAAYHLSLETSFLADEGATLPKLPPTPPARVTENLTITEGAVSIICNSSDPTDCLAIACQHQDLGKRSMSGTSIVQLASDNLQERDQIPRINSELDEWESSHGHVDVGKPVLSPGIMEYSAERKYPDLPHSGLVEQVGQVFCNQQQWKEQGSFSVIPSELELSESSVQEEESTLRSPTHSGEVHEPSKADTVELNDVSSEYFSTVDNQQSILVSFSSRCVLKGTVCERSQLLRIKFYGSFDKPLGRYLRDDLFDQTSCCRACNERTDAHVLCYTHQQGNLTINVKQLPELDLPGKRDGKIWMWHRCLRCAHKDGVPPATPRGIMSDAAWGLSFGKFLELSFSNHATANRVASCGHSLQRDCLRYYGFGSMVAFFRYSPIDILSVRLPRSMLEFGDQVQLEWVKNEAVQVSRKMEVLYAEVFDVLHKIEQRGVAVGLKCSDDEEFHYNIADLKDLLKMERNEYESLLQPVDDQDTETVRPLDILELNRLRRCLLIDSYFWDRRLYALDSLLKTNSSSPVVDSSSRLDSATYIKLKEWRDESFCKDNKLVFSSEENISKPSKLGNSGHNSSLDLKENPLFLDHIPSELTIDQKSLKSDECCTEDPDSPFHHHNRQELLDEEVSVVQTSMESVRSPVGSLSDKIDSAWTGTGQQSVKDRFLHLSQPNGSHTESVGQTAQVDNPSLKRVMAPARVYSFDSAVRLQEKMRRELSPPPLSSLRSFHASGEYMSMVRDPVPNMLRTFSQVSFPSETKKLKFIFNSAPSFISSASQMAGEGVRLLLPQTGRSNIVIPVYDNEPTSVISYALGSKEYEDWISNALVESGGVRSAIDTNRVEILASSFSRSATSTFSVWQSSSSIDSDDLFHRSHASEDASSTTGSLFSDTKRSPHVRISFGDESSSLSGKAKFSVVCYFARQFDALRKTCCPREVDFISSLSRGKKWNAQGGKSNVYFAKSLDDRFIIKQITKTELDSFEEFAPEYFKYLMDSLTSGSPTCLAKVLGIYQVSVKHLKGGRGETKLDIMVMENLFFRKKITSVYDLKGSLRSRYNSDPTGKDKVLLDMNLLETMRTNPMFLGSKAKRSLERAVWNDTSFLASIDVMDYSLLVGVDEENKELVLGIIDYIRQYTWDKHLETWVKASGILGGPKNESPTVISPKQYKKRFRKAMSTYFLTVPEQWSS